MNRLSERVVIVTGAAQGIGATYARALAAEGAYLGLCDLNEPSAIADELRASGAKVVSRAADVTSPDAVQAFVRAVEEAFGTIHVLVNNAAMFGTLRPKKFTEIGSNEWDAIMAVNTRGPFECAKAAVPAMRRAGYGKIINIASGTVFKGSPYLLPYVASKGAVIAMTRVMARELGDDGIGVNCIAPGLTMSENVVNSSLGDHAESNTASRCFKRRQTPEDIVGALLFLASTDSDFVTGQTLVVDGGSALH